MRDFKRMCHKKCPFVFLSLFLSLFASGSPTPTEKVYSRPKATDMTPQTRAQRVVLDKHNWNEMVEGEGRVSFIKFFAPWCGHCQAMAADWERLGRHLENKPIKGVDLVIGTVDCMSMKAMALCLENQVEGYPAIKLMMDGVMVESYLFARTYERMKRFLFEKLVDPAKLVPSSIGVYMLDDSTFQRVVEDKENVVIVKFFVPQCTHCQQLAPVWEETAIQFLLEEAEDLKFAEVNCMDPDSIDICEEEAVTTFPTIYTYKDGLVEDIFDGEFELKDIENYIWRTVDPSRMDVDDGFDEMLALMTSLTGGTSEDDEFEEDEECYCGEPDCDCSEEEDDDDVDYEDEDYEDQENENYDDDYDYDDSEDDDNLDSKESNEYHDEL